MTSPATRTVLVVDDDPDIRSLIEDLLSLEGYRIISAPDGAAALSVAAREQPDVILLDLNMPVLDGQGFARAYRATPPPHAPIVCMTAAAEAERRCREIDADASLGKPFEVPDLFECIAHYTRRAA